ncbi:MAG: hypothetical protein ACXABV_03505 [Candidatus Thorarchaeota archaeon]|jgi:hypothetical protein
MSECPICDRPSHEDGPLCQYHQHAQKNLRDTYEAWAHALEVDWTSYLDYVYAVDGLGSWVREVIEHVKSEDGSLE